MKYQRRTQIWWTRERTLAGLRRYYDDFGVAPTSDAAYQSRQQHTGEIVNGKRSNLGWKQKYPSSAIVYRYFPTFHEAWTALGIKTHRGWQEWTAIEDWFVLESCGILPRSEVARLLNRSEPAIKRRIYDLGGGKNGERNFAASKRWGWTLSRTAKALAISRFRLEKFIEQYKIPVVRGNKCFYLNPSDLLIVKEIDWTIISPEIERVLRKFIIARLCFVLRQNQVDMI